MPKPIEPDEYDLAAIAEQLLLPVDFLAELVRSFFDEIWKVYRQDLLTAIESGSLAEIRRQAHRVKGAVANLRFEAVSRLLNTMEELADEGRAADFHALLREVDAMLERIRSQLLRRP